MRDQIRKSAMLKGTEGRSYMDKFKIVFYISTGLISLMMLLSAGMYILSTEQVAEVFTKLGYPTYIIYPLAAAKILGLLAIWSNVSRILKEWAYAGFFFDFVLAFSAHLAVADGEWIMAAVALVLLGLSYLSDKKMGR